MRQAWFLFEHRHENWQRRAGLWTVRTSPDLTPHGACQPGVIQHATIAVLCVRDVSEQCAHEWCAEGLREVKQSSTQGAAPAWNLAVQEGRVPVRAPQVFLRV
jgi:hypothetical protein